MPKKQKTSAAQDAVKEDIVEEETSNSIQETSNENDFESLLKENPDAAEFMQICKMTGEVENSDGLDEYAQAEWLVKFEQWKETGKPRPNMPRISHKDIVYTTAVYRIREGGRDKVYCYQSDGSELGTKNQITYEKTVNPLTGKEENDLKNIKRIQKLYTKTFDYSEITEIISHSEKFMPAGSDIQLYVIFANGAKNACSKENFFKSYEDLVDMVNKRIPLN